MPTALTLLRHPAVKLGLRLIVALTLATAVVAVFRGQIFKALLPPFLWEIAWLGDDFRMIGIGVQHFAADTYIGVKAAVAHPILGAGKILYPDTGFELTAATLSGYVLQTIIVFAGVVIAWPVSGWRSGAARVALGLPVLMMALMIDVPLVLLSTLWQGVLGELGDARFSPLLAWGNFLSYGGRLGLAILAGVVTALLAERLAGQSPWR